MNDQVWGGTDGSVGVAAADGSAEARAVRQAIERVEHAEKQRQLDSVELVEKLLWSYVGDLENRWQGLDNDDPSGVGREKLKEAKASVRDLKDAAMFLASERNKLDKARKNVADGVGAGCLDLDAARDEVGRRLACLRRGKGS